MDLFMDQSTPPPEQRCACLQRMCTAHVCDVEACPRYKNIQNAVCAGCHVLLRNMRVLSITSSGPGLPNAWMCLKCKIRASKYFPDMCIIRDTELVRQRMDELAAHLCAIDSTMTKSGASRGNLKAGTMISTTVVAPREIARDTRRWKIFAYWRCAREKRDVLSEVLAYSVYSDKFVSEYRNANIGSFFTPDVAQRAYDLVFQIRQPPLSMWKGITDKRQVPWDSVTEHMYSRDCIPFYPLHQMRSLVARFDKHGSVCEPRWMCAYMPSVVLFFRHDGTPVLIVDVLTGLSQSVASLATRCMFHDLVREKEVVMQYKARLMAPIVVL
jgi:hypothetical protein